MNLSGKGEGLKESCGLFGIYNHSDASSMTLMGLYALQHRGQESAGITSSDSGRIHIMKGLGLVSDVFRKGSTGVLKGSSATGHVRYSTTGPSLNENVQPLLVSFEGNPISLCHNGNLINTRSLKASLEKRGAIFQSTTDTEIILHLISHSGMTTLMNRIIDSLNRVSGAYSLIFLTGDKMIAVRDPSGFRPLAIGEKGPALVVASETCALDQIEARYIREVEPGEMIIFEQEGVTSFFPFPRGDLRQCIFEFVYFARPDSRVFGESVYMVRYRMGHRLGMEGNLSADVVIPIPDSGTVAALGYSASTGIPLSMGLVRSHYIGRTFIEPLQNFRRIGVRLKLNPVEELIRGKRVVLVDDSIVRATTSGEIIRMVREAGANEVHFRVASPPITSPCFYGVDTPRREELIASSMGVAEISKTIGADSLSYLSLEGLEGSVRGGAERFCLACFTGRYPLRHPDLEEPPQLKLFKS